jgi:hypothetical protein
MIKEIVDIGRVSNKLGSVFTFKDLPEFYVEIILEWNGKDFRFIPTHKIRHLSEDKEYSELGQELYLKYGVHRGKKSSTLYIFPSSFVYENKDKTIKQIINFLVTETKYNQVYDTLKKLNLGSLTYDKKSKKNKIVLSIKKKSEIDDLIYQKILEKIVNDEITFYPRITKYFCSILKNIDQIDELANSTRLKIKSELKGKIESKQINELVKKIPIIVKMKKNDKELFFYQNKLLFKAFEHIEFTNSANPIKTKNYTSCNVYTDKKAIVYPSGGFYYPFSTDKVNVKYNLKDDKNLFLLSKEAYLDFMVGRTFLEIYNSFYYMGISNFITATSLNDNALKEFQSFVKDSDKKNLDNLISIIEKSSLEIKNDILLNFYFWEPANTGGGKEIIEYVKDIIPSQLVQITKLSKSLTEHYQKKFNREKFQFNWQQHIYSIYHKDAHKKFRTSLFREIALDDTINLERLMLVMNENMQYSISKAEDSKDKYYYGTVIKHLMFLNWLDKINKGEINRMSKDERKQEFFEGKTYEYRLNYFLSNGNLVKDSASMKVGVCIGLTLNILSWSINGYDKKTLAFVGKRIERNNLSSVQAFMNEIFSKTKFHEYEGLQSINIRLATNELLHLDNNSFNKDEFIFGIFLGSELYRNVKSEKDPEIPTKNEEDGEK